MKKLLILFLFFFLYGCKAPVPEPAASRLVTRVCISTDNLYREYTDSKKIAAVLDYLRFLPLEDPVLLNPEQVNTQGITIELTYHTGGGRSYVQKGQFYLSRDDAPFMAIAAETTQTLWELLEQYPSDEATNN